MPPPPPPRTPPPPLPMFEVDSQKFGFGTFGAKRIEASKFWPAFGGDHRGTLGGGGVRPNPPPPPDPLHNTPPPFSEPPPC